MLIGGFQKLTLIDYTGKLATTVFTVGCSFRCPFCHNPELILAAPVCNDVATSNKRSPQLDFQEKDFFRHLKKRRGKLEGVCITGGEPTIQPDIIYFIKKIKKLGFLVKLDTNGSRPDILKKIIDQKLVDFIAMDIKNHLDNYSKTAGVKIDVDRIQLSVSLIRNSDLDYEFRTTVVPGIHTYEDFKKIAEWLKGAKKYYLQKYREIKILDPHLPKKTKNKTLDLQKIKKSVEPYFGKVGVRE